VAASHAPLITALSAVGVAVVAHLGLRPQSVGVLGGYRYQGRSADDAESIVSTALLMQKAGAAALLLETVPAAVGEAVVDAVEVPVIGCGAGPACHASVMVTADALGLTPARPRFVPLLDDLKQPMIAAFSQYVTQVASKQYPAAEHQYEMPPAELTKFRSIAESRSRV
jgi:3-methyl-2-oxobutanoate hydroxymethyltransferase